MKIKELEEEIYKLNKRLKEIRKKIRDFEQRNNIEFFLSEENSTKIDPDKIQQHIEYLNNIKGIVEKRIESFKIRLLDLKYAKLTINKRVRE